MRHFSASLQTLAAGVLLLITDCAPSVYTSIQDNGEAHPVRTTEFGIECKLSKYVGIEAEIRACQGRFSSANKLTEQYTDTEKAGITCTSLNGGRRFYS